MEKSATEYLNDYIEKYKELESKNELWRLRVSKDEFIKEIERINEYGIKARESNYFNEYQIQQNEKGMVAVLLMNKVTIDEAKEQFESHKKYADECFKKDAPRIQEKVKNFTSPLKFNEIVTIYSAIFRNQITIEHLPKEVLTEFKETRQYNTLIMKQKIKV